MLPEARMLSVDLTERSFHVETIPEPIIAAYLGGRGLGAYLLYKTIGPGIDPLSPENPLIFSAGLVQGMSVPFSPKAAVTTKSPLTGIYLYSISSGAIGHSIRRAGYLAVMIRGKAESPLYLRIVNDRVEFRDARHLWGMTTLKAQEAMIGETGDARASAAVIGPGGERLIRYAGIFTEGEKFRAFGRGGAGCVMGSKNLKGMVISGDVSVSPRDPEAMTALKRKVGQGLKENNVWAELRRRYGTGDDMPKMNKLGMLPTRNWQTGVLEETALQGIAPMLNKDRWPRKNISCGPYCPNPCSHSITIGDGPYRGAACDGPEYETMYVFGSNMGIGRFDAIVKAAQICDEAGIDTMSAGLMVSFLTECFTKGLIDESHTDGIPLRFGDDEAVMRCLNKIVARDGAGYLWGEGTRIASGHIPGSSAFAMHCKGLEMGGYECRGFYGQALQFALNPKGGDHHGIGMPVRTEAAEGTNRQVAGKGALLKKDAVGRIVSDSLVICVFPRKVMVPLLPGLLGAVTGEPYTEEDVARIGMRILTQERLFNVREGLRREDDTLPARLLTEPLPDGPNRGSTVPLEELKDDAYATFGWDLKTGIPEEEIVRELGIIP
jgi:aldehyde:ferredoxin oxidoreductase